MLIRERLSLTQKCHNQKSYGVILLSFPANPHTVKVSYMGETVIPECFSLSGYPIISEEMTNLYLWKNYYKRLHDTDSNVTDEDTDYDSDIFEVTYEKLNFNIPKDEFNSVRGIKNSLKSFATFREMLLARRLWCCINKDMKLNEYVVFGKYLLDNLGQILLIKDFSPEYTLPTVCTYKYFSKNVSTFTTASAVIAPPVPVDSEICPCCGKEFDISDLKHSTFGLVNGKIAHESCRKAYYRSKLINEMSKELMDVIYKDCPDFDLLPNGYCNRDCCSHLPWFRFHTTDGDIIIGWRKHVISIEWQENFKPFDMAIFNGEDVTKWCKDFNTIPKSINHGILTTTGKRGIHAWGREKAFEYLKKVHNIVSKK